MLSNVIPVTWHPVFLSPCVQLRLTVAEAVGSMCHLMASDKLEEQIPKLIPAILSLYKKNNEHYVISKVRAGCCISVVSFGFHNLYHLCSKPSAIKKKKNTSGCNELSFVFALHPLRVCASCSMLPSAWAAGCWRHNWTAYSWYCMYRYMHIYFILFYILCSYINGRMRWKIVEIWSFSLISTFLKPPITVDSKLSVAKLQNADWLSFALFVIFVWKKLFGICFPNRNYELWQFNLQYTALGLVENWWLEKSSRHSTDTEPCRAVVDLRQVWLKRAVWVVRIGFQERCVRKRLANTPLYSLRLDPSDMTAVVCWFPTTLSTTRQCFCRANRARHGVLVIPAKWQICSPSWNRKSGLD